MNSNMKSGNAKNMILSINSFIAIMYWNTSIPNPVYHTTTHKMNLDEVVLSTSHAIKPRANETNRLDNFLADNSNIRRRRTKAFATQNLHTALTIKTNQLPLSAGDASYSCSHYPLR
jgi:hypothetical protein